MGPKPRIIGFRSRHVKAYSRPSLSLEAARIVAGANHRNRLPHDDEAGFKMRDQPLGNHLGCGLGGLISSEASTTGRPQREADFDVLASGRAARKPPCRRHVHAAGSKARSRPARAASAGDRNGEAS
jgi:hypothetical protein